MERAWCGGLFDKDGNCTIDNEVATCRPVVVVTGEAHDKIKSELDGTPAIVVKNPEWHLGLGTSLRCGLRSILSSQSDLENVILLLCDQPFADATIIQALIQEQLNSGKSIVASAYAGTVGVPALFNRGRFKDLLALPNDCGAKSVIESQPADVARVIFEKGVVDIDTVEDFERLGTVAE